MKLLLYETLGYYTRLNSRVADQVFPISEPPGGSTVMSHDPLLGIVIEVGYDVMTVASVYSPQKVGSPAKSASVFDELPRTWESDVVDPAKTSTSYGSMAKDSIVLSQM